MIQRKVRGGGENVEGGEEPEENEEAEESVDPDEAKTWSQAKLHDELRKRGLPIYGKKDELLKRLLGGKKLHQNRKSKEKKTGTDGLPWAIPSTAHWQLLKPAEAPVPEPLNIDPSLRGPTEREGPVNLKYKYEERFDRAPFTGTDAFLPRKPDPPTDEETATATATTTRKDNRRGLSPDAKNKPRRIPKPRVKGGPNVKHIERYGLDLDSEPLDWFRSFMPLYEEDNLEPLDEIDAIGDRSTKFCVQNWTTYTNQKAAFAGAGRKAG